MQATMRRLINLKQEPKESLNGFCKRFLGQLEVTEDVWGKLIPHKMKGRLTEDQEGARNKYLACVFLAGVDCSKYGKAVDALNNDFVLGTVSYPGDVPSMMALLSNRRDGNSETKSLDALQDGAPITSFMQQEKVICHCCGALGHTSFTCWKRKKIPREDWWIKKQDEEKKTLVQRGDNDGSDSESGVRSRFNSDTAFIGWNM
jgi:hypothetical protein